MDAYRGWLSQPLDGSRSAGEQLAAWLAAELPRRPVDVPTYAADTPESREQQWKEFRGYVAELEMPFFYVPGNHDARSQTLGTNMRSAAFVVALERVAAALEARGLFP